MKEKGVIDLPSISDYARMVHIIYEDNHLLVVKKFIGVPSQKDKSEDPDMVSILKEYLIKKYNKPGDAYIGNIHRLDRMVGGLMVFAKTSKAASRLSKEMTGDGFEKRYYAVVNGTIEKMYTHAKLEEFLTKDEKTRMSKVDPRKGKYSSLQYCNLGTLKINNKEYSLIDVTLETGRHHQIRVQMAAIGHPLYGDVKYAPHVNSVGENLGLWAYYLSFLHPITQTKLSFKLSPEPVDVWKYVYDSGLLNNN